MAVYPVSFEHIIDQSANKIPYDSLSNLETYLNERISCERTIIYIFVQNEGNVGIL